MLDWVLNSSLLYKTEIHEWKIVFFSSSCCIEPGMIWFSYWTVSFINSVRWILSYQISITISQRQTYHFFIFLFCFCFFEKAISKSLDFLISLLGQNVIYTENLQVPPEVSHPKCQFPPKIPIWTNFLLHERSEEWFNPPLHYPGGIKTMKYLWICQCICLAVIKL